MLKPSIIAKILEKGVNPILPETQKEKEKIKTSWEEKVGKEGGETIYRTQLKYPFHNCFYKSSASHSYEV